ncbi:Glycogen debranching enzyme [compost metagenome]
MNFVTAHDGFTLRDVVSYEHKHNEANGEENRDGHDDNRSANYGVEGPTDDPELRRLRLQQMRNLLATLLFSQGTPMLLAGDEFSRTQGGNNNVYCQDNELGWIDWNLDDEGRELLAFTRRMIRLRRAYPILRRRRFLVGEYNEELGVRDVTWLAPNGEEMTQEHWHDPQLRSMGMLLDGRAQPSGIRRRGSDATLLLLTNAHHEAVEFLLPAVALGRDWQCLLDTGTSAVEGETYAFSTPFQLRARSLVLLALRRESAL